MTSAAERAAFMSKLQKGFDASVYIALQVAQLHPAVGIAMAAYNVASGNGSVWDALAFAGVAGKALSLIRRAEFVKDLLKARKIPCKCMIAGTMVLTPSGAVPIESLEPGGFVLAVHDAEASSGPMPAMVLAVSSGPAECALELAFADGGSLRITPDHVLWIEGRGWRPGDAKLRGRVSCLHGVGRG